MKIFFISPFCLLRPTTNRIFDVRFCDMMSNAGTDVTLIHPYYAMKENIDVADIPASYGVTSSVKFRMLHTPLHVGSSRWWQLVVLMTSFFFVSLKIVFSNGSDCCVIGRDHKSLLPVMMLKKIFGKLIRVKVVNTVHEVKRGRLNDRLYKKYDAILVTTAAAKETLINAYQIPATKIERLIAPVGKEMYRISKEEARIKINYTDSKPLVVYTGKLGKGIRELDYILDAAGQLPGYNFVLTGGKPDAVDYFKKRCEETGRRNIFFPGFMNDATFIRYYQVAADALVSYYTKDDHTVEYNFPQKLIEYMHSGNPIVTPDFPATHDIINASNAILVEPDEVASFVAGIRKAIENSEASKVLAKKALTDIQRWSGEKRGEQLLHFFKRI
jgi:glycosyltransferase involved in cell wall biosynthesis